MPAAQEPIKTDTTTKKNNDMNNNTINNDNHMNDNKSKK